MIEASDEDLVRLTAAGDKAAFTKLVGRHQQRLLALACRALGNRAAAEDIVQEVFTRAWVNAPSWQTRERTGGSYGAWLSRVATNLVIDQVRKVRPAPLDDAIEPEDPAPRADQTMVDREAQTRIRAAIAALPERQRIAVALTYDSELSNAEGARSMGISVGAFELLLVRARRALRTSVLD